MNSLHKVVACLFHRSHFICICMAGFEKPSAIQQRAIMPILSGRDVIAQAQSGTGKTATIGMVTLETIDTLVREPQVWGVTVHK